MIPSLLTHYWNIVKDTGSITLLGVLGLALGDATVSLVAGNSIGEDTQVSLGDVFKVGSAVVLITWFFAKRINKYDKRAMKLEMQLDQLKDLKNRNANTLQEIKEQLDGVNTRGEKILNQIEKNEAD